MRSWGSSFSIVSDYRLDNGATGVRSPTETKHFSSSLCIQTNSEAHPASYPMGTGYPLPGGKTRPGRDADHAPHLVQRSRMSRSYISSLLCRLHGSNGIVSALFIWLVDVIVFPLFRYLPPPAGRVLHLANFHFRVPVLTSPPQHRLTSSSTGPFLLVGQCDDRAETERPAFFCIFVGGSKTWNLETHSVYDEPG
jgi:hypothetical protein